MIEPRPQDAGHVYRVAGLSVGSNRRAEGLPRSATPGSVRIEFGTGPVDGASSVPTGWHRLDDGRAPPVDLREDGSRVRIADDGGDVALQIRRVLPFAAALQGRVMLHAAAVRSGPRAVIFVGESGAGKSTIAAGLGRCGFEVLSDDLLPCVRLRIGVRIEADAIDGREGDLLTPAALCFLSRQARLRAPRWTRLARAETLRLLLLHGFGEVALPRAWVAQFDCYQSLASDVPGWELTLPDARGRIDDTLDKVADEIVPLALIAGAEERVPS